ncbi:MAG: type II secretion system major pseudopilin GspG [Pseudomonadota bacterium]
MNTQLRSEKRSQRGVTLVEILVVLAIIGLLAGLVGPQVLNALGGAKSKTALIQIRDIEQALEMYKLDVGRYPNNAQGLSALVQKPSGASGWNGPYLKNGKLPPDPWGTDFLYRYPGEQTEFDIYTLGEDASPGGDGESRDIGNWE